MEAEAPVKLSDPTELRDMAPVVIVFKAIDPEVLLTVIPPAPGPVMVVPLVLVNVKLPPIVNNPVPVVTVPLPITMPPLLAVCNDKVLSPISQVEAAAPVRARAPAEDSERAPDVVVDKVNGPEPTVSNKPPVLGPVMDLAVVPEKVILPPEVNMPAPVVMPPPVVCNDKVLLPISQVDAATPVKFKAPAEVSDRVPDVVVDRLNGPEP